MSGFLMKYMIIPRYLTAPSLRRPGIPADLMRFMVAHDTGNPGSTAAGNVYYYENSRNVMEASAHIFVDDKQIIECIPFLTGTPEKAWHVVYNVSTDNDMFGDDANDVAGGVELCYGGNIDMNEAYKRYVWVMAYSCWTFHLDPTVHVTGHFILDPARKVDPMNALKLLGKSFQDLIIDIVNEYTECVEEAAMREELEALKKEVEELKARNSMAVPEWAKEAVAAASSTLCKDGKPLIDTPDGGSYDFYRLLTTIHRKGLI
ncbi:peptidoglycan recognition protein family protein [Paenibacillus sp. HWE-109]|uniref:peptidoglycan recognition protein family protein n=1 Tax=Paenibacillus sp. HWE-109 TaxID=1306526 RepID=UPI001EDD11CA|nr:peptidoglycan recognition family protein [Paenibacillus sp. HWE-109]UKS27212.1 peptidoglycan recognition protein family protein [Paenibacillus sp. HWE-109]